MTPAERVAELSAILDKAPVSAQESARIQELIWGPDCYDPKDMYLGYGMHPYWERVRTRILETIGRDCEVCLFGSYAAVHHITYERLGAEWLEDLAVVCAECHRQAHYGDSDNAQARRKVAALRRLRGIEERPEPILARASCLQQGQSSDAPRLT
jgi:hypothetical protein